MHDKFLHKTTSVNTYITCVIMHRVLDTNWHLDTLKRDITLLKTTHAITQGRSTHPQLDSRQRHPHIRET